MEEFQSRIEQGRVKMQKMLAAGASGNDACAALTAVYDKIITDLWRRHGERSDHGEMALIATGSWGRKEMCPYSNIDFILVARTPQDASAHRVLEQMLYPLWEAKLMVGHVIDDLQSRARLAGEDLKTATDLFDGRHIAGNPDLTEELVTTAREAASPGGDATAFIAKLMAQKNHRHEKFGDTLYLLEPDLNHGIGTLRDLCTARWAAMARFGIADTREMVNMGLISYRQFGILSRARDFMLALRSIVRFAHGEATDRLVFKLQEAVAPGLYPDAVVPPGDNRPAVAPAVEALMQQFYRHARGLLQVADHILELAETPPRGTSKIHRVDSSFITFSGKLAIRDSQIVIDRPSEMYRLFRVAKERDLAISGPTRELCADIADSDAGRRAIARDPECARLFLEALADPDDIAQPSFLEQMHEVGLVVALIPEFEPCTCRVQHDLYHVYTVDQHLLYTLAMLKRLARGELAIEYPTATEVMAGLKYRRGLYLGALLHDIGKPQGKGYADKGAQMVKRIAERLGMEPNEVVLAEFLVRQHLIMAHLSQRRDLSDPEVIARFAGLVRDEYRLANLYLCSLCDTAMTAPGNLSPWKNELLRELFLCTRAYFRREPRQPADAPAVKAERTRARVVELLCSDPPRAERDRIEPFVAGMDERFFTALNVRQLARLVKVAWLHEEMETPVELSVTYYPLKGHSELAIVSNDVPGLLAAIAACLAANRIDVLGAVIGPRRKEQSPHAALDLFYVRDLRGRAIPEDDARWSLFRSDLGSLVTGRRVDVASVRELLAKRRPRSGLGQRVTPAITTEITVDNDASHESTVVEIVTRDGVGVLYAITDTLTDLDLDIRLSKVATEGERVTDTFYVTLGDQKTKLTDPEAIVTVKNRLLSALASQYASSRETAG